MAVPPSAPPPVVGDLYAPSLKACRSPTNRLSAMTALSSIDPAHLLHGQLARANPDLPRQMLATFINTLTSAEADAVFGGMKITR